VIEISDDNIRVVSDDEDNDEPPGKQVANTAATDNRQIFHAVGDLHSPVDGTSTHTFVQSSSAFSHSQPSTSGTATGSLLKSYQTSQNVQGGRADHDQVTAVA
jgi:hypothetical protein